MTYSKTSNINQDKDVKYLNKDYNSFKNQLLEFAQTYFPNNFNDFSEGNPAMMFLEMASYVGDVLSFYTDTQLRESFLSLAQDQENLFNLAHAMGYKPKLTTAASVNLDITQLVPSDPNNDYEPDYDFALTVKANSTFLSIENATNFYITKDVRFGFSSSFEPTTADVYQYDSNNNVEYWLLKKTVPAISAQTNTQTFTIGVSEKFKTINLFDSNIISIESITDSEGNTWTEVPYLAQDTVFKQVENTGANDPTLLHFHTETPFLLKLNKTTKRFISKINANGSVDIQFGAGTSGKADEQIIPNPDNIGLGIKDGRSKLDTAYDPSNFLYTKSYGEAPANTTLTVTYLTGGGLNSNVNSNTITETGILTTSNKPNINAGMLNFVQSSLASTNVEAAVGGGAGDSVEDIRLNSMANFSSQQRTVTKDDYIIRTLSMPPQFGRVAKAYITQDDQTSPLTNEPNRIPNPLALNLYTLGYNSDKQLTTLNLATKNNLMTYLEQFRMLTDAINIKDAFVINFQIDFEITCFKNYNNEEVLLNVISKLQDYFLIDKWQINQPLIISEIQSLIVGEEGVQSIVTLDVNNISGLSIGYSQYKYSFNNALRDGVIYPSMDPSIFELKYPNTDINGRITTY
tara:strand:- start:646 stop:2538 length:1893 start_codon:yes stop_codon:yes gene_type:complete